MMYISRFQAYGFVTAALLLISGVTGENGFEFLELPANEDFTDLTQSTVIKAKVGKLFHFPMPKNVDALEIQNVDRLPQWILYEESTGLLMGVPLDQDIELLLLTISKVSKATESLVINVVSNELQNENICLPRNGLKIVEFVLRKNINQITPAQRVELIVRGAKYLGIPNEFLTIIPFSEKDNSQFSKTSKSWSSSNKIAMADNILVAARLGCSFERWNTINTLIRNLTLQSTIDSSSIFGDSVFSRSLVTDTSNRKTREVPNDYGSGDYDEEYYDDYESELKNAENNENLEEDEIAKLTTGSSSSTIATAVRSSLQTHPHRHHHGENKFIENIASKDLVSADHSSIENTLLVDVLSTTEVASDDGKHDISNLSEVSVHYSDGDDYTWSDDDLERNGNTDSATFVPIFSSGMPSRFRKIDSNQSLTTEKAMTKKSIGIEAEITVSLKPTSEASTKVTIHDELITFKGVEEAETAVNYFTDITLPPPETISSTTLFTVNLETILSTESTTAGRSSNDRIIPFATEQFMLSNSTIYNKISTLVTENRIPKTITEPVQHHVTEPVDETSTVLSIIKNYRPFIENRLQYLSVTAGKVFKFIIPEKTFKDAEDGYNLTLQVLDNNNQILTRSSWVQFNSARRELYGLPLLRDVSNWVYVVKATDRDGESEQDQLTIQVQQHALEKVVNHEFSMTLGIEKPQEYLHYVDWSLKILEALGKIYGTNMSEITVRNINATGKMVTFTWTNDSLPTGHCPRNTVEELFKILTANDRGDPSWELSDSLAPSLRIKKVAYFDLGICAKKPPSTVTPGTNFSPILRNPVDKVNATLNELLIFKVNEDTFYDPEDVDPAMLNITLLTSNFKPIPPTSWLQFDSKNREFFGIPRKISKSQYWLVCVDTGGMTARDSLEVEVYPSIKRPYNVEFSMTIEVPFDKFSTSAILQRKFVEKLMDLFEDSNSSNLHFPQFKPKHGNVESTIVYWFNKSLVVDICPTNEIRKLEYILHNSDHESISSRVHRIMSPEFTVSTIKVHHLGNCKSKSQSSTIPDVIHNSVEEIRPPIVENEVMVTFVLPAMIVTIMLFISASGACVLYRRRNTEKLGIEEDGKQSHGNKGIPVIFQEELDEKLEPGTKTPIILKDEKPPLAPPEYSRSGSLNFEDSERYQPPPPFTRTLDNFRQSRPKPTPSYRKPPPYVPP